MPDQLIRIKIPKEVIEVPGNEIKAKVKGGEIVVISLEPENDGIVTISESGDGIFVQFKKKPFDTPEPIADPPGGR